MKQAKQEVWQAKSSQGLLQKYVNTEILCFFVLVTVMFPVYFVEYNEKETGLVEKGEGFIHAHILGGM